jgi:hypothetical protein
MTVARKPGHRGERGVSRKPPRRESRIASAGPVCSCAFSFVHLAHETAGAARIRLSLRPLLSEGGNRRKARAHRAARMRSRACCLNILNPKIVGRISESVIRHLRMAFVRNGGLRLPPSLFELRRTPNPPYRSYLSVIASPLRSALAISPNCRPDNSSTAPFWFVSTMARAPPPTAMPAPAAP